jgi:hypothetical protein
MVSRACNAGKSFLQMVICCLLVQIDGGSSPQASHDNNSFFWHIRSNNALCFSFPGLCSEHLDIPGPWPHDSSTASSGRCVGIPRANALPATAGRPLAEVSHIDHQVVLCHSAATAALPSNIHKVCVNNTQFA